jgi:hypothetical protein
MQSGAARRVCLARWQVSEIAAPPPIVSRWKRIPKFQVMYLSVRLALRRTSNDVVPDAMAKSSAV